MSLMIILDLLRHSSQTGSIDKDVVASVAEALPLDSADEKAYNRLKEIFANDSLQMATFTITEKGYSLVNAKGETMADVAADLRQARISHQAIWARSLHFCTTDMLTEQSLLQW